MHNLIVVQRDQVRLAHRPEDVVMVPDDFVLPPLPPADPPTRPHVGTGTIRIVAALINPIGQERGNETVTLLNTSPEPIDLTNWVIADNTGKQTLNFKLTIGETQRVSLSNNIQLSNTRDTITLLDAQETIIDQVSYESNDLPDEGRTKVF